MPIRTYGPTTTAAEIVNELDLHGHRVIVTGASSGIGIETARALASVGAEVTLAVRNVEAGTNVADEIGANLPPDTAAVRVAQLDLADPASVAGFVRAWTEPLHILVNNAGVMALPQLSLTAAGYEMQFATNHLGHFALATGLHRWLAAAKGARVVSVASIGHLFSPVVFDDLHYRFRPYDQWTSYGQSKSANVLFAVGAAQRWADARAAHGRGRPRQFRRDDRLGPAPGEDDRARRRYFGLDGSQSRRRRGHRPLLRGLRRGHGRH
jgi:NAD(P)-dependent dehydrogenase (short-subunit alcohol dehydrogenase family)